jgi:hypothetical protein
MGINASDFSGLADSTTYYFKMNAVEFNITTGSAPTYQDVCTLVNAAIVPSGYSAFLVGITGHQDIRIADLARRGYGGDAVLTDGTSGNNLFSNLISCPPTHPTTYAYSRGPDALVMVVVLAGSGPILGGEAVVWCNSYGGSGECTLGGASTTLYE